ncbi:hypothetical protein I3842_12G009600 [Carya illinoinensis]|uniref:Uncharacterized protein n=1 Tax=Carya illinoinensis TaxID=32201 RepID=A0A922DFD1_CARIL|nr:hypothetical protein I3842_12G009600 [Carya illinoinensis]
MTRPPSLFCSVLYLPPLFCELNFLQILHLLLAPTMCTHRFAKENWHLEICGHAVKGNVRYKFFVWADIRLGRRGMTYYNTNIQFKRGKIK